MLSFFKPSASNPLPTQDEKWEALQNLLRKMDELTDKNSIEIEVIKKYDKDDKKAKDDIETKKDIKTKKNNVRITFLTITAMLAAKHTANKKKIDEFLKEQEIDLPDVTPKEKKNEKKRIYKYVYNDLNDLERITDIAKAAEAKATVAKAAEAETAEPETETEREQVTETEREQVTEAETKEAETKEQEATGGKKKTRKGRKGRKGKNTRKTRRHKKAQNARKGRKTTKRQSK